MSTQMALYIDHRFMVAWNRFCETDEFKNVLRWAVKTKYNGIQREQHIRGAMQLAFTQGMKTAETVPFTSIFKLGVSNLEDM